MKLSSSPEITVPRLDAILTVCTSLQGTLAVMPQNSLGPTLAQATEQVRQMKDLLLQQPNIDHLCPLLGEISTTILDVRQQIEHIRLQN